MPQIFCSSRNGVFGVIAGSRIEFPSVLSSNNTIDKCLHFSDLSADVITFSLTECGKFIVLAFTDNYVRCYSTDSLQLVGLILLKKRAISIICTKYCVSDNAENISLLTDKSGDLYALELPTLKKYTFLGGHTTSIITDICRVGNFLATADRDEKIRIVNYPDTFIIEAHCLGHASVISSLSVITNCGKSYLVSTGWDHKLIIWQPSQGRQLDVYTFHDEIVQPEIEIEQPSPTTIGAIISEEEKLEDFDQNAAEEELSEKDESAAGTYPFKAICGRTSSLIFVIFRDSSRLEVLKVSEVNGSGTSTCEDGYVEETGVKISKVFQYELPAIPCDFVLSENDEVLLVAFPCPHLLVCFDVINAEDSFVLTRRTNMQCPQIEEFNEKHKGEFQF